MINYQISENISDDASNRLNSELKKVADKPVLVLLSGGSALVLLDRIDDSVLSSNITIVPLDERYSLDGSINNMAQIAATKFYEKAKNAGCKFIDTRVRENETQEELRKRFERNLLEWFENNPGGIVIATVGIGHDGHISGMMRYPENTELFNRMFEGENLVVAYNASGKNEFPNRVTTTMTLMRKIHTAIVYVVGENKKDALVRLKSDPGNIAETPARILLEMNNVILFTDQNI